LTNIKLAAVQCRMARAALRLGVRDLAARTGLSRTTITMFEGDRSTPTPETLARIQKVFEDAGLIFVNDDSPGVRIRPRH
jgi:transcriptional regulator with XRE-family HTH domain